MLSGPTIFQGCSTFWSTYHSAAIIVQRISKEQRGRQWLGEFPWHSSENRMETDHFLGKFLQMISFGFPWFPRFPAVPQMPGGSSKGLRLWWFLPCAKTKTAGHQIGSALLEQSLGPCAWSCRPVPLRAARNGQGFLCGCSQANRFLFVEWWQNRLLDLAAHGSDSIPKKTSGDSPKSSQQLYAAVRWIEWLLQQLMGQAILSPSTTSVNGRQWMPFVYWPVPHWFTSLRHSAFGFHAAPVMKSYPKKSTSVFGSFRAKRIAWYDELNLDLHRLTEQNPCCPMLSPAISCPTIEHCQKCGPNLFVVPPQEQLFRLQNISGIIWVCLKMRYTPQNRNCCGKNDD